VKNEAEAEPKMESYRTVAALALTTVHVIKLSQLWYGYPSSFPTLHTVMKF